MKRAKKPNKPKAKVGRPDIYTDVLGEKLCSLIAGDEQEPLSLREACKKAGMPSMTTVCKWLTERKEFAKQYARARELQADWYFDEIDKIARDCKINKHRINIARLRVDTLKWKLAKMLPKKYGDKLDVAHEGSLNLKGIIRVPVHPGEGK